MSLVYTQKNDKSQYCPTRPQPKPQLIEQQLYGNSYLQNETCWNEEYERTNIRNDELNWDAAMYHSMNESNGFCPFENEAFAIHENDENSYREASENIYSTKSYSDHFDERAAQEEIDAIIDGGTEQVGYNNIVVQIGNGKSITIQTQYRNTSSQSNLHNLPDYFEENGETTTGSFAKYEDHIGMGENNTELDAKWMIQRHPDIYMAGLGKGSPEQVQEALNEAVSHGVIHADLGLEAGTELTKEHLEAWSHGRYGIDCIGLVMHLLLTNESYQGFEPTGAWKDKDGDGKSGEREDRKHDWQKWTGVNVDRFTDSDNSTKLDEPAQWRAMDVIVTTGETNHIRMIRDCTKTADGSYKINCVEASGKDKDIIRSSFIYEDGSFYKMKQDGTKGEELTGSPEIRRAGVADDQEAGIAKDTVTATQLQSSPSMLPN